jgi:hypothetical protein
VLNRLVFSDGGSECTQSCGQDQGREQAGDPADETE